MDQNNVISLDQYLDELKEGEHHFENAHQAVSRMILEKPVEKIMFHGKTTYDYKVFRESKKPVVGMYDEINSFVNFVKNAAEGGSASEMAFVFVGEPGTGKTYIVNYLCEKYRDFLSKDENMRYTFRFKNLNKLKTTLGDETIDSIIDKYDRITEKFKNNERLKDKLASDDISKIMLDEISHSEIKKYGRMTTIESQTYEDPLILAMNLFGTLDESKEFLLQKGFKEKQIKKFSENYRYLGACTQFIFDDIKNYVGGDVKKILEDFIEVVPVSLSDTIGTVTGKYSAGEKITATAVTLRGDEDIQRLLDLADTNNPYRINLRIGALARVAGGGIHFSDEIFKNKKDLVQIYLGVIQDRNIEANGSKWPIDTLIIATSNPAEFNRFKSEAEESPIVDRCRICYVSHNTNYKLQEALTRYALGSKKKTTITKAPLHEDPNLHYVFDVAMTLTRALRHEKLTPIEELKLLAGETAGEKSMKTLAEVVDEFNANPNVTKRFGQSGLGHRDLERAVQLLMESSETNEGKCMHAHDAFKALERVVLDETTDNQQRAKFLDDLNIAKGLYREKIETEMFDAYMDEPHAIKKDVMNYVNMVIALNDKDLSDGKMWKYKDPQTGEFTSIKIDRRYVDSVEKRIGLKTEEEKESFRTSITKVHSGRVSTDPNYDFMDNEKLVKAVTDVKLKSDIAGAGSLVGALANQTNDENVILKNRMIDTMLNKLSYCKTCAEKTIQFFCTPDDNET